MHVLVKKNSQRTQRVINMIPSQTLGFHDSMFFMCKGLGLGLWCLTPLSKYFCYIVAVIFIGGGNQSTLRKPTTCLKSLANFIL